MNTPSQKADWLRKVAEIRFFEETLSLLYPKGLIRCPVHLAVGHEGAAVGVCSALDVEDRVFSYHRSHHHFLAKGGSPEKLLYELLGSPKGCSGGRGGSTHLYQPDVGFMGSTAIISSTLPASCGLAHSLKLSGSAHIVASFCGDAAVEEGVFFEVLNMASLWRLPLLIVVEDNDLSCYTNRATRQAYQSFSKIAELFQIPYAEVDGADVENVYRQTVKLKSEMKEQGKPALFKIDVFRAHEHCGPDKDDHLTYRKTDADWPKRDPLFQLGKIFNREESSEILNGAHQKNDLIFRKILQELEIATDF